MLDIKFIRENKDLVAKAIKNKNCQPVDLDRILILYDQRKLIQTELDELNKKKNEAARVRDIEVGKRFKTAAAAAEEKLKAIEKEFIELMIKIPNIPSPDTPVGPDESANKVIRIVGRKPEFSFKPKTHWELGKDLSIIDNEKAAEVTGSRFTYIKGDLALLQLAIVNFTFKVLTDEKILSDIATKANLNVKITPFIPIFPPVMIKPQVLNRMSRLNPREDKYYLEKEDLFLVGSAEHTIGPLHLDETIPADRLPIRYVGYSTCFRREAGSYGKDTKGILRMHQFDKIEMETFCCPGEGIIEQDFLVAIQEYLMQTLALPYQVVAISTGDMGFPDQRQIDLETWMPGQTAYRETHSADFIGGFQPRRLNTRVKLPDGQTEYVHMNDATAFALGRTLIAIMENYQTAAGTIKVPQVLRQFVGLEEIKK